MSHKGITIAALGLLALSANSAWAWPFQVWIPPDEEVDPPIIVVLAANSEPDVWDHPGPDYNIFDPNQLDDHAIYYSAADWMRGGDLYIDGVVDSVGSFGMNFGNYYHDYPEGYDRQIKHIQEYMLAPAYDAGITAGLLTSATLTIVVDHVIDMSLEGNTDLLTPEWMYINVFVGDGLLTTIDDAQLDFDRCDRNYPETWDIVVHLVSDRGYPLTEDELDFYGGTITFDIDVTDEVRPLLVDREAFAGFAMAGSHDGDFTLMSVDGGAYPKSILPMLTLATGGTTSADSGPQLAPGPALASRHHGEIGDFNGDGTVNAQDLAQFQECIMGLSKDGASGCQTADLDGDGDVDEADQVLFRSMFTK